MTSKHAQQTSAKRWPAWRRGVSVSVTPADTRLYRVVTGHAEHIIGVGATQLALIGARPSAWASAADLLAFLDRTGFLRVQAFRIDADGTQARRAEATGELSLFARETIAIEPLEATAPEREAGETVEPERARQRFSTT
ncbi:MAG: hypothetical protein GTO28_16485 [Gammaproteobacteria bacterium]|nr:hypothetical protein [Gammaproteobacteria bacterium]NIM74600.1 hypothetical protein [Gammaproteobacteria bacterium]NIO26433.1 hypothetical protein [Gammaproteobacteria bacterium]NIO66985.1 hypothetical protein [Gammaproteobacteria bacterium]NIP46817.1 hypothetical protein [Gammaproteobacteria bacterium]